MRSNEKNTAEDMQTCNEESGQPDSNLHMYFLWEERSFYERDDKIMKFFIYSSDWYYPSGDTYDTLPEALVAFEKLKEQRKSEMEFDRDPYFVTDYLGIILDEIDKEKMKLEMAPFVPEED